MSAISAVRTTAHQKTSLGWVSVVSERGRIVQVDIHSRRPKTSRKPSNLALKRFSRQLDEYLRGRRRSFALPVSLKGTPFQRRVWRSLLRVRYGQTVSYGALARRIGSPGAARAVGGAVGSNPLAIVVPCHRVLASTGLGGYAYGLARKRRLLRIESGGGRV